MFDGEGSVGIFFHECLKKFFVDCHHGDLAGNLDSVVHDLNVLAWAKLLRLVGELLVVLQTLLGVPNVFLKCALRIILSERFHPVGIKKIQVIQVGAIREGVLSEDHVTLAAAGLVEHRGNETTGISAACVNHSRTKRVEHGVAVIEKCLRRPVVRFARGATRFLNGTPDFMKLR